MCKGNQKVISGEHAGLSLLSSRQYTLRPPVSSALAAKRWLHRTKGALGGLSDWGDGRDGKGTGDGQFRVDLAGEVANVFDSEVGSKPSKTPA